VSAQRRLGAIVSADVAGHSRLMDRDESGGEVRNCRTFAQPTPATEQQKFDPGLFRPSIFAFETRRTALRIPQRFQWLRKSVL